MVVLSIMETKFNRGMTTGSRRTGRSGRSKSRADSKASRSEKSADSASKKSEAGKSEAAVTEGEPGEIDYNKDPTLTEKGWFDKNHVQNFLLMYLAEKQRSAPMQMTIGHQYAAFIAGLAQPIELNKSRKNFRDTAWAELRRILRTPDCMGDEVLANMLRNCEKLGISRNVFNMVNECFWDLYFKRPHASSAIKGEQIKEWFSSTNLVL